MSHGDISVADEWEYMHEWSEYYF